jgi:hypothetical protein
MRGCEFQQSGYLLNLNKNLLKIYNFYLITV